AQFSVRARLDPPEMRQHGLLLALFAALACNDDRGVIHHRMGRLRLEIQPRWMRIELRQVVIALLHLHALDDHGGVIAEAVLRILRECLRAKPECENYDGRMDELHLVLLWTVAGRVRRRPQRCGRGFTLMKTLAAKTSTPAAARISERPRIGITASLPNSSTASEPIMTGSAMLCSQK